MSEEAASAKTIEINDAVFCADHVKEVVRTRYRRRIVPTLGTSTHIHVQCGDCEVDTREENDAFFGVRINPLFPRRHRRRRVTSMSHIISIRSTPR
jgi:hypothetical protein